MKGDNFQQIFVSTPPVAVKIIQLRTVLYRCGRRFVVFSSSCVDNEVMLSFIVKDARNSVQFSPIFASTSVLPTTGSMSVIVNCDPPQVVPSTGSMSVIVNFHPPQVIPTTGSMSVIVNCHPPQVVPSTGSMSVIVNFHPPQVVPSTGSMSVIVNCHPPQVIPTTGSMSVFVNLLKLFPPLVLCLLF